MRCVHSYLPFAKFRCIRIAAIAVAGAVGTLHLSAQGNDAKLSNATVHVQVYGPFGEQIATAQIHLFSSNRERDLSRSGQDSVIAGVPYGSYILSAWDAGGGVAERELTVNTNDMWVRIGLALPAGDRLWPGGALAIIGDIRPAPTNKNWWVRVDGVFLHASKESPVSNSGKFSMGGLDTGIYLLEVFEGSKLRQIETVELDSTQTNKHLLISIQQKSRVRQSQSVK
jgi:hypothetical protein